MRRIIARSYRASTTCKRTPRWCRMPWARSSRTMTAVASPRSCLRVSSPFLQLCGTLSWTFDFYYSTPYYNSSLYVCCMLCCIHRWTTEVHLGQSGSDGTRVNIQHREHFSSCAGRTRMVKSSSEAVRTSASAHHFDDITRTWDSR